MKNFHERWIKAAEVKEILTFFFKVSILFNQSLTEF